MKTRDKIKHYLEGRRFKRYRKDSIIFWKNSSKHDDRWNEYQRYLKEGIEEIYAWTWTEFRCNVTNEEIKSFLNRFTQPTD